MSPAAPMANRFVEWAVAQASLATETVSGDRAVVLSRNAGVLLAVIDGLGHGEEAAEVADATVALLQSESEEAPISLLRLCHEKLRGKRGVVMSLGYLDAAKKTLTWAGIGNVEGLLVRGDLNWQPHSETLLLRGGVLGIPGVPVPHAAITPISPGDTLIFATDGIRGSFTEKLNVNDDPQHVAQRILAQHRKENDDALVLVARFLPWTP